MSEPYRALAQAEIGPYIVQIHRGFFKNELVVRRIGWFPPVIASNKFRRDEALAKFDEVVAQIVDTLKPKTWQSWRPASDE